MQHWISVITGRAYFDAPSTRKTLIKDSAPASVAPAGSDGDLSKRRGEVLRGLFPKITSWFEDAMDRANRREVEAYLSKATDLADLEDRMRRLQNRDALSRYFY